MADYAFIYYMLGSFAIATGAAYVFHIYDEAKKKNAILETKVLENEIEKEVKSLSDNDLDKSIKDKLS